MDINFFLKLSKVFIVLFSMSFICISTNAQYVITLNDIELIDGIIESYTNKTEKNIVIPSTIDTIAIIGIGYGVFANKELEEVIFNEGLETIGNDAFKNNNLTNIIIPKSVNIIGNWAFAFNAIERMTLPIGNDIIGAAAFNSNKISELNGKATDGIFYQRTREGVEDEKNIISYGGKSDDIDFIPKSVIAIHSYAFANNGITSVSIPKGVEIIGDWSFSDNALTEIDIPKSVTKICDWAFFSNALESVNIPNSVTSIGNAAFNNNVVTEMDGMPTKGIIYARMSDGTENKNMVVSYCGKKTEDIIIPPSILTITDYAFAYCNITSVSLPRLLNKIGNYAFYSNFLTSIEIPNRVSKIEKGVFANNKLSTVELSKKGELKIIADSAFAGNSELNNIILPLSTVTDFNGWRGITPDVIINDSIVLNPGDTITDFTKAYIANDVIYAVKLTFKTQAFQVLPKMTFTIDNTTYKTNLEGKVTMYVIPGSYKFTSAICMGKYYRSENLITIENRDRSYNILMENKRY